MQVRLKAIYQNQNHGVYRDQIFEFKNIDGKMVNCVYRKYGSNSSVCFPKEYIEEYKE